MDDHDCMTFLLIYKGKQLIKDFKITADDKVLTIGLLRSNDIYLPDDKHFVSRIHAAIIRSDLLGKKNSYFIRDLGSTHGTKIGKTYIRKKILHDGDKIDICDYTLVFKQSTLPEYTCKGLSLDEIYGKLSSEEKSKQATIRRPERQIHMGQLNQEKKEFVSNITRSGLGADFLENPSVFMNHLTKLLRVEKYVVGYSKDGRTYLTYQSGFERESIYCSEEFLTILWEKGPIKQEAALWIPLPDNGFLALFRSIPPAFENEDLDFMCYVYSRLMTLGNQVNELYELTSWPSNMVGIPNLKKQCIKLAQIENMENNDVLIMGETGTGKEVIARFIHENSGKKHGPFVTVNCSSLPRELAYGELFGYEKGAFTGATTKKQGYFEIADGGTLFLDEIGDVPENVQVALLTAMQQKEILHLGSEKTTPINVRILAATDRDVEQKMQDDTFRRALYERFAHTIIVPPLRERREDITLLAHYFLDKYSKNTRAISREALQYLREYDWPGNVRELQNIIKNTILSGKEIIFSWDLPKKLIHFTRVQQVEDRIQKETTLKDKQIAEIIKVLNETRGNVTQAARILSVPRSTLYHKVNVHKIDLSVFK